MEFSSQSASTIYNVGGDLRLEHSAETIELLRKKKQEELSNVYSTSYIDIIRENLSNKKLVTRTQEISTIEKLHDELGQFIICGVPGIGKTVLINQFLEKHSNTVYISVKNKSPLSIFSYLTNKIKSCNNEDMLEADNLEISKNTLQAELQKTEYLFIIDDCEKDTETTKSLIGLEKFKSKFIFIAREIESFKPCNIHSHSISPFSEDETKFFIELNSIALDTIKFNELYFASKGNPLYLYYFSQYQINPLLKDIQSYQDSIWSILGSEEQELLIYISIPLFPIEVSDLIKLYPNTSPLVISKQLNELSGLVKNNNGVLSVFHPSFSEHVIDTISSNGLKDIYQTKLGEYFINQEDYLQAVYLLIDSNPEKIKGYLFDIFPVLTELGELELGIKALNVKLKYVSDELEKGYIHYHLSHSYHLLGQKELSQSHIDTALIHFEKVENKKWHNTAMMTKAMNLIEDGFVKEGVEIADKILSSVSVDDKLYRAQLLVNISKIYIDTFEITKAVEVCKEAYQIFEELQVVEGMINSLTNLISSLGQNDNSLDEAEKYGLKLLELSKKESLLIVQVIVLNSLTSISRQKKKFLDAKQYGNEVIKLCQQLKMKDKVILNLVNLGNVIRDEGDIDAALKTYNEALIYAKEYKLRKDEARIYWILADLYRDKCDFELSLQYAQKSIDINLEINYYYGIANASRVMSNTLSAMGRKIEAAKALESSAEYYKKISHFATSYQTRLSEAINIYFQEGENNKANELLNELIISRAENMNISELADLIIQNKNNTNANEKFQLLFENYFTKESFTNIVSQILLYVEYCKSLGKDTGEGYFINTLHFIIENLGKVQYSYSILGMAIEQSGWLLEDKDLFVILEKLQNKLPAFFVRNRESESIIITSINNKINLEFLIFNDELACMKLMLALVLLLNEIESSIFDKSHILEKYSIVWIHSFSEAYQKVFEETIEAKNPFDEHSQTIHMGKKDWSIQDFIIVSNEYEQYNNINENKDNKCSLYFFVNAIANIKGHFYHLNVMKNGTQRRQIMNLVGNLMGYDVPSLKNTEIEKTQVNIDFENLKQSFL
ncbi:MAG: tetratricopeptide repeat protein [Candidatus Azobacteroides sp.]|nr:tetratricopeptide repeat protein [Candidatus Azobacteroides sp.]